jgi:hypothetical protein
MSIPILAQTSDSRGRLFFGFDEFQQFSQTQSESNNLVLISPVIGSRMAFNELVLSWNVDLPADSFLEIGCRALYAGGPTAYYDLGSWSKHPEQYPRQSRTGQRDSQGEVATDTLLLHKAATSFQVRLRLGGSTRPSPKVLRFLGISVADTTISPNPLAPRREAWGKLIEVPERSQMRYPNGKTLCSPTTVSMLLSFWGKQLGRPEIDRPVPEIAEAVYDTQWHGVGNWSFNMAYAGAIPGLRACVVRLSDVAELEAWVARGIPVGLSVDYDRLRGKGPGPNGHLVVLVGFTEKGDPIVNDPGTSENVRKIFPRKNLVDAWGCSHNTVYLVYPEKWKLPKDVFDHWESRRTLNGAGGGG